jgi:pyruvate kinase
MTPTQNLIATQAQRLIPEVAKLYERALKLEQEHTEGLQRVAEGYHDSARNLLHYLAIRQVDVRQIQMALAAIGLSSLGRMEAHTLSTLNAVLFALHRIADQDWKPAVRPPVNFDTGRMLLARHAKALLGVPAGKRSAPIMVTIRPARR